MVTTHTSSHVFSNSTLVQILDDLCVRFIINLPTEEMHSVERVCFQIEEAQWYYEDFVRGHNPSLPSLNLRNFASKIFQHCPSLHEWKDSHEQAMNQFIAYKSRVPVRGAILLNYDLDQCVLVRGMKSSASWSFPRGKINQDEMDDVCAVREVLEETGYDASESINPEWYIEQSIRSQNIRLYIVPGVSLETQFAPRTRNEIGTIQWHHLSDLPTFSKKRANGEAPKMGKFYMVAPFLPQLRKWIQTDGAQWKQWCRFE
ncbi:DCP2-domain-containing protein [Terfezia boudieri ATCC MYA-4762]|uniref:DCP2-domain-containing protein n=1 Tax=Terfezia boudieri ATCC MYA-4762 TaxID=1051890 RepID=A0A3N4L7Y0_9PEZI|nr:DCP2-domain-containing protein [Terfezia boudieri ATCC MYA-4762]